MEIQYIASDGTIFKNFTDCDNYEYDCGLRSCTPAIQDLLEEEFKYEDFNSNIFSGMCSMSFN